MFNAEKVRGRKNGCPLTIKDWQIKAFDKSASKFVRVRGLQSMSYGTEGETEDGSESETDWAEPYVKKRSGSVSLEGRPICYEDTGALDEGQQILCDHSEATGCDADLTLEFVDPYGHAFRGDYVVTSYELSADEKQHTITFDLEQVGKTEPVPFVLAEGMSILFGRDEITEVTIDVEDAPRVLSVVFTPSNTSYQRFRVKSYNRSVVAVRDITESGFSLVPLQVGEARIVVTNECRGITHTAQLQIRVIRSAEVYESAVLGTGILGRFVLGRRLSS